MKFQCLTHGSVDKFKLNGYEIAHHSAVKAHEKDFEGITFVVDKPDEDEITANNIEREGNSHGYLEKFAGWDSDIAEAVQRYYRNGRGTESLFCPHRDETNHLCITHIVDQVFIPDVNGQVIGSFRVIDDVLKIHNLREMGGLDSESLGGLEPRTFFNKIINQAQSDGIKAIKISTYDSDLKEVLEDLGFETRIGGGYSGSRGDEYIGRKDI